QSAPNVIEHDLHRCGRATWGDRISGSTGAVRRGTPGRVVRQRRGGYGGLGWRGQWCRRRLGRIPRLDAEEIAELILAELRRAHREVDPRELTLLRALARIVNEVRPIRTPRDRSTELV